MYVGVDIGGSKTLIAALDDNGVIVEQQKIPTPTSYDEFLIEVDKILTNFTHKDFYAAGVAAPGRINRREGVGLNFGNLSWTNVPLQVDLEKVLACPVVVENDANLAALSEAMLHKEAETVLYVTVSTGIGTGVVYKQKLDPTLLDSEGGHILVPYRGKLQDWETFASGKAIYNYFGKKAAEITDEESWKTIARNLAVGLYENIAIIQPDLVVIGGSIGTFFSNYAHFLENELKKYELPIVPIPPIVQAGRPEEAVIYGCYDLAKAKYGHH